MSLLNPVLPEQMTPAEQALEHINNLQMAAATPVQRIADYVRSTWLFVWQNPFGLSPQEACDIVHKAARWRKSTAADAFAAHAAAVAFLNAVAPGLLEAQYASLPPGVTYTVNEDGSLTLQG